VLFPEIDEDSIFISRNDSEELLGTFSPHDFNLEGVAWPSVEHYYQAMKFETNDQGYFEKIRTCESPKQARKLGRSNSKNLRSDWAKVKRVVMTRALYTKCRTHSEIADYLLSSKERKILEDSQYDYFWGCGRDRRAENTYGRVLMDVRGKLRKEI